MDNQDSNDQSQERAPDAPTMNEKEVLMQRARLLGIEFSNNIGIETLRQRIAAKIEGAPEPKPEPELEANALTGEDPAAPKKSLRQELFDEEMRLIRVRITCMDPKKKDLQGEIFTVANEYLGTVRKFVPFGEATEDGFHIPKVIYTMLEERRFLNITTKRDRVTGAMVPSTNYAKEFAIEVLPPLTELELARLATAQAAAGSIDSNAA